MVSSFKCRFSFGGLMVRLRFRRGLRVWHLLGKPEKYGELEEWQQDSQAQQHYYCEHLEPVTMASKEYQAAEEFMPEPRCRGNNRAPLPQQTDDSFYLDDILADLRSQVQIHDYSTFILSYFGHGNHKNARGSIPTQNLEVIQLADVLKVWDESKCAKHQPTLIIILDSCFSGKWYSDAKKLRRSDLIVQTASSAAESAHSSAESGNSARPDVNDQRAQETADFLGQHVTSQYDLPSSSRESLDVGHSSDDQEAQIHHHQACGASTRAWLRLQQDPAEQCYIKQHPRCYGPGRLLVQYKEQDGRQYFKYSLASGQLLRFVHSKVSKEDA